MIAPLYDAVNQYIQANPARFHVPGHGGIADGGLLYGSAGFDATELSFSDNLLCPKTVILDAERLAATAYGANHTLFFTGGCTSAIFAAVYVASTYSRNICVLGEPHRSAINAFSVFNLCYTVYSEVMLIPKAAGVIFTTSPNYFGEVRDIAQLRGLFPQALLIVDEAHGAHFAFSPLLPNSAVSQNADIVINGMHKTLPVYTGGAVAHANSADVAVLLREGRALLHTTSPSYLVMCSMDYARALFSEQGNRLYAQLRMQYDALRLPQGFTVCKTDDFTRLVIQVPEGTTGYAVQKAAEGLGIFFEFSTAKYLIAVLTPFNADRLHKLSQLSAPPPTAQRDLSFLLNKTALRDIGLYPPGDVIVKKGEIITRALLNRLQAEAQLVYGIDDAPSGK